MISPVDESAEKYQSLVHYKQHAYTHVRLTALEKNEAEIGNEIVGMQLP